MEKKAKTIIALGDGLRLELEVEAISSQGLRLRALNLQRRRQVRFGRVQDWVPGQMRYLTRTLRLGKEPLEVVDYDAIRELGLMRSVGKPTGTWKEFFELSLDQGFRLILRRYSLDWAQGRKLEIAFGLTQLDLIELVDTLGLALREAPEREEEVAQEQAA